MKSNDDGQANSQPSNEFDNSEKNVYSTRHCVPMIGLAKCIAVRCSFV